MNENDFPILKRKINGNRLVYLDSTATTQKPQVVIDAVNKYYSEYNANVHRGIYTLSEEATEAYESTRKKVAEFINADPEEIIFVRNATEAINLVANSWGDANVNEGDKVVSTIMEHHSNIVPWQLLADRKKSSVDFVDISDEGYLSQEDFENKISQDKVKLAAFTHVSNALGTINPVKDMIKKAKEKGLTTLVDGAQSVPHMPVDVKELDCDFLAFSSHKMLGPTGTGVLYGKRKLLEEMTPFNGGGEMIKEVTIEGSSWNDLPWKFEAGTPNIAGVVGFGAAIDYLKKIGMSKIREHEQKITKYALEKLKEVDKLQIHGPKKFEDIGGIVSFTLEDIHAHDLADVMNDYGVELRAGHHCAMPLMKRLNLISTTRASFYIYNEEKDVDTLVESLKKASKVFRL